MWRTTGLRRFRCRWLPLCALCISFLYASAVAFFSCQGCPEERTLLEVDVTSGPGIHFSPRLLRVVRKTRAGAGDSGDRIPSTDRG